MNRLNERLLVGFGGVFGAVGVASAAMASHGSDPRNLAAIAAICLAHGPALLALGLAAKGRGLQVAGLILLIGTLVFVGDLALREYVGPALFPGAAPLGGGAMIVGWLGLALCGFVAKFGRT